MTGKAPTDVDRHVAARLKARRQESDYTQVGLAAALRVTFQQLQKYETGANRVTAGRLYQIAKALEVPITYFFEGLPDEPRGRPGATALREHADHEVQVQANVDAERRNAHTGREG